MENGQTPVRASHKFQKGVSGNPAGRPKGSKNKISLMKLVLEGDLRTRLAKDAHEILAKAIDMAKAGDADMIKLLVNKMIPTSRSTDDEPAKERVQININRLESERPIINGRVISEEVTDV